MVEIILSLLGGLALFLYGMQMMSGGLEDVAGNKMKRILQRLTSNRFLGIGVGAGLTALVQSSSATTVMTVGFVNSGLLSLKQAVWIIMGANIGTTITGQLIALDVGVLAPLFAIVGVSMVVFIKNPRVNHIGKILAGLGVLFIGMNMMSDAMYPLRESQEFINIMSSFSNPILGIAAGAIFTAIIQSSAASIGILQALAIAGVVEFDAAVFVLFGQNIGTCITALLASVGTNRAAKRTTIIHFMFNMIGTAIFTLACLTLPVTDWVASISVGDTANQIANMHTIFNIVTTVLLIPFGTFLANFAERVLPDNEPKGVTSLASLGEDFRLSNKSLGLSAVHTAAVKGEILGMIGIAAQNAKGAYDVILNNDEKLFDKITAAEETLDLMNKEVSQYISKILVHNNSGQNVDEIEQYFSISGNIERIGDHAINIAEYINIIKEKEITFSERARAELREMQEIVASALERLSVMGDSGTAELPEFVAIEQKIDDITEEYREKHLERMREGKCTEEACILFSELLTDFERIGDHILNIAQAFDKINK